MQLLQATSPALLCTSACARTALRAALLRLPSGPSSTAAAAAAAVSPAGPSSSTSTLAGTCRNASSAPYSSGAQGGGNGVREHPSLPVPRGSASVAAAGRSNHSSSSPLLTAKSYSCVGGLVWGPDDCAPRCVALLRTSAAAGGVETSGGDINNAQPAGTREAPTAAGVDPHYQDSSSEDAAAAILRRLDEAARGGDPTAVLQVVERQGQEFNEAALVAALRAVAHTAGKAEGGDDQQASQRSSEAAAGGGQATAAERLASNATYQSLLSMVVAGSERLSAAQAVEVAASLGRLHLEDQMVLDSLGRNLVSRLHELSGSQLADLVEAYAHSNATPGKVLADAVHQRLQGGGSSGAGDGSQQRMEVDESRVAVGRATADGVQLGTPERGGEAVEGRGEVQGEDAARVRRGLARLGYGAPADAADNSGTKQRQGQSDRSQGLDYA